MIVNVYMNYNKNIILILKTKSVIFLYVTRNVLKYLSSYTLIIALSITIILTYSFLPVKKYKKQ